MDIKTKDVVKGTIKTLDKVATAGEKMKRSYISTKDIAEHSIDSKEGSAEEFASNKYETATSSAVHNNTKRFYSHNKTAFNKAKEYATNTSYNLRIKTSKKNTGQTIKESARASGKRTIKTLEKGTYKGTKRGVKTAERTAKTTIKTAKQAAKSAEKTAKASVKAAQRAARAARIATKVAVATTKAVVKATIAAVKAIIAAIKGLIAIIVEGGWVAVVVILIVCVVAMILCSVFGIFFGDEVSTDASAPTLRSAISQIQSEFNTSIKNEKSNHTYTYVDISGATPAWKEVLAIYSVKTVTDPINPQEVVTIDEDKIDFMREVFWEMNSIQAWTEDKEETVTTQYITDKGEVVTETKTVTNTYLYIIVNRKSVEEMAKIYSFNDKQKQQLYELLSEEYSNLWNALIQN